MPRRSWLKSADLPSKVLPGMVLLVAAAGYVRAEPPVRNQELSLDAGVVQPLSNIDVNSMGDGSGRNGAIGFQGGVQYFYDVKGPKLAVGLDVDYLDRGAEDSSNLIPNAASSVSGQTFVILAALKYRLDTEVISMGTPYVSVGVGVAQNSTVIKAQPQPYSTGWVNTGTFESRELVDDRRWVPAAALKFGMDFQVAGGPNSVGVEVGWTGLANADYSSTSAGHNAGIGCPTTGFPAMLGCSGSSGHQYNISNASGPLNLLSGGVRWNYRF